MKEYLYGRSLLISEIPKALQGEIKTDTEIEKTPAAFSDSNKLFCNRCHMQMTVVKANECFCASICAYCRHCIQMGKVRACEYFYSVPEPNDFYHSLKGQLKWRGELSKQQSEAAQTMIETIIGNETRLLWAVAGAGKTEMLFPGIEFALSQNKRICIATPRVDVVLELAPRIKAAFPNIEVAVLHGSMEESYMYTPIVISTTHQLYRFKEAFDVMIIDEIDAFPFHLDTALQTAAQKARKKRSAQIYLSATPDQHMQKAIKQKKLQATILPARYHGYALPVPYAKYCPKWREKCLTNLLKTSFGKDLDKRIKMAKRFLVFAPNIDWMLRFEQILRGIYPKILFETVSAEDPKRKEKVRSMRMEEVQFLISTTILERGVTFPNIDVLVIGAEDRIFTESALVQIAGRAGRAAEFPHGEVIYFHDGQSVAMKKAIKQIKTMNLLAKEKGLI